MNSIKYRIWDTVEGKWFETLYNRNTGELREAFLSQNGELFIHERDKHGKETITPQTEYAGEPARYRVVVYSGIKDREGVRYFVGDYVRFTNKGGGYSHGVLVWDRDTLAIGSGPLGNYTAVDPVSERELREAENMGNIYESPEYLEYLPKTQAGGN